MRMLTEKRKGGKERWKEGVQCALFLWIMWAGTKQSSLSVCVKCWENDTHMNSCCNRHTIKMRSMRFCSASMDQWPVAMIPTLFTTTGNLSGHSTSQWVSWCDAQNKILPGHGEGWQKTKQGPFQNDSLLKRNYSDIFAAWEQVVLDSITLQIHRRETEDVKWHNVEFIQVKTWNSQLLLN